MGSVGANDSFYFDMIVHFIEVILVIGIAMTVAMTKKQRRKIRSEKGGKAVEGGISPSGKDL